MLSNNIGGKPSNIIGDASSQLILKGTSVKIQWGNKFIDIIKNGKINTEVENILQVVNSEDDITSDGIYLIKDDIWININGVKKIISNDSEKTYVSFLTEQNDITGDQKTQALKNIGFYYKDLEEVKKSGITAGIVYVQDQNKLFVIKSGEILEYSASNQLNSENVETTIQQLQIVGNALVSNNTQYLSLQNSQVIIEQPLYVKADVQLSNNTKFYTANNESYMEIDNIIEKNHMNRHDFFNSIKDNIISIKTITYNDDGTASVQFYNQNINDTIWVSGNVQLTSKYENETLTLTLNKRLNHDIPIQITYTDESEKTVTEIINSGQTQKSITIASDKKFTINFEPFIDISKYTISKNIETIENTENNQNTYTIEDVDQFFKDNSNNIYNIDVQKYACDSKFNEISPNIDWVKRILDVYFPIGTILLFDVSQEIPAGWSICDGSNNTPDLQSNFIKKEGTSNENINGDTNINQTSLENDSEEKINMYRDLYLAVYIKKINNFVDKL